jgi:hypothetical protein
MTHRSIPFLINGLLCVTLQAADIAWVSFHSADDNPAADAVTAGFTEASDIGYTDLLTANGHAVTRVLTSGTPDVSALENFDLVIIGRSVPSSDYQDPPETAAWHSITTPMLLLNGYPMRANRLGFFLGDTIPDTAGPVQMKVNQPAHPIFAGVSLDANSVTVNPYADLVVWFDLLQRGISVITSAIAGEGTVLATVGTEGDPAFGGAVVAEWKTGATMGDSSRDNLAGNRVSFLTGSRESDGLTSQGAGIFDLTEDGTKMFLNAVAYAASLPKGTNQPPPEPIPDPEPGEIAWVSFHPEDDTPSGAAATAGFTRASDVAYTDLLKTNGFKVTRLLTTGSPDTNRLNKFSLIIISRSVPSGDYQDPPETAAWNGITRPMMILGGYALRATRLGFYTGDTIPDTTGPVQLAVNNPAHPIFAGISLDANNLMVNPYSELVSFNDTEQRGVSVNTDLPAEGATVLATVGTDFDAAFGGTVIAEWEAGATLANASADVLGGDRLVFLTGSREVDGLTSEGAGIYNLTADGAKMFLNAVRYLLPQTVSLRIGSAVRNANGSVTISWQGGVLQSSPSLSSPTWTPVAGATSPYTINTPTGSAFYRLAGQ